ncbi:DUF6882 domain-containing protein [Methanobrevibacter sp.]|uniref:DUF6882 domain-containing protein n=1 Tax=Methanobrevibacter sp. TaxID=66852 RepID=UPI003891167B
MFTLKTVEEPIVIREGDSFKLVLSKYGAIALDKQENLYEYIGDVEGDLDLDNGILSFGDIQFPVQVLGFFNDDLKQWSWAWDSEDIFGADLIKVAAEMKQAGIDAGIPEFSSPIIQADFNACHTLSMATVGILDLGAYYAINEDGLDIFVAIDSDEIPENNSVVKFKDTFYTFQKNFKVYSRIAFDAYTRLKGYKIKHHDDFDVAYLGESRIIVGFTQRGNVRTIQMLLEEE